MTNSAPYQLRGHVVSPKGVDDIRQVAVNVRKVLGLTGTPVNLCDFLDGLMKFGITAEVIEDEDSTFLIAGVEAYCNPETATITLTAQTYQAARRNDPRTRFTIFHELGHLLLQHSKTMGRANVIAKRFIDSEWQADQFSAEMTMPLDIIKAKQLLTPTAIAMHFKVSFPAAASRIRQLTRKGELP